MLVQILLDGMKFNGNLSIRRKTANGIECIGGGASRIVRWKYGAYNIVSSCLLDGYLILYIE